MTAPLHLGNEWTIAHATPLHQELLGVLLNSSASGVFPPLDLSAVESMDSAGLQLLLGLRRSLLERGQELHITATSAAVRSAMQVYRVSDLLMPPTLE